MTNDQWPSGAPAFTVFTPTYNRAHTLRRVYESLLRQRTDLLEWLVVDDGSTDTTQELLAELAVAAPFPVRVIRQPNRGKHVAHNRAVATARGELTVILDSDDELLEGALDELWSAWTAIPSDARSMYAGVVAHSVDACGLMIGKPFPRDVVDCHFIDMLAAKGLVGDKLPCYRTDVLRQFPFPGEDQRELVPEGMIWCRIGQRYLLRFVNRFVLMVHQNPADLQSLSATIRAPSSAAYGKRISSMAILEEGWREIALLPLFMFRHAVVVVRSSLHMRIGLRQQYGDFESFVPRLLWAAALPVGAVLWMRDTRQRSD